MSDCALDSDCGWLEICAEAVCEHKGLSPFGGMDFFILFLVLCTTMLASSAGIGGGGLLVPLFMLVGNFDAHAAVPLSKATIFGSAVANFIILSRRTHPHDRRRPLIAYDVALMLEPMTLLGTTVGVYANTVFPAWVITVLLVALLGYTTKRVHRRGKNLEEKERHAAVVGAGGISNETVVRTTALAGLSYGSLPQQAGDDDDEEEGQGGGVGDEQQEQGTQDDDDDDMEEEHIVFRQQSDGASDDRDFASEAVIDSELSFTRRRTLQVLGGVWAVLFAISLLKGGEGADSLIGIGCGSVGYWFLALLLVPVCVWITLKMGQRMALMHQRLLAAKFRFLEGDVVWTSRNVVFYPMLCTWAGVAAGMLGIGGGMVKGPLMLEMGMIPQVSSATSAFMILFTSSATTVQFLVLGALDLGYAVVLGLTGFAGAYAGQTLVGAYIKRTNRTAVIIFALAWVLGLSTALMTVSGVLDWWDKGFEGFEGVCG